MQWLVEVHNVLSNMIGIYALVAGIWGLINFLRRQAPDGSYNAVLAIAVGLFVVEGIVGVILVLAGYQPARGLHFLYGVTIVITIPAIFAFTRGSNTVRESLLYGVGMLFIWGLAERALDTALNP
jgi:heme A synthase